MNRHPTTLIKLLQQRNGKQNAAAILGGAVEVTAGTRDGETANLPDDVHELLYDDAQTPAAGDALVMAADKITPLYVPQYATIEVVLDQAGTLILTGQKMDLTVDFACTVVGWSMFCSPAATARIDVWKKNYAGFPPVVGDSMCGIDAHKPKTTAAVKGTGTPTGSSWTTALIAAGDILRFNLDTNDAAIHITLSLKVRRD